MATIDGAPLSTKDGLLLSIIYYDRQQEILLFIILTFFILFLKILHLDSLWEGGR